MFNAAFPMIRIVFAVGQTLQKSHRACCARLALLLAAAGKGVSGKLMRPAAGKPSQRIGNRLKSHDPHPVPVLQRKQWNQAFFEKARSCILGEQQLGTRLRFGLTLFSINMQGQPIDFRHCSGTHVPSGMAERLGQQQGECERGIPP